MQTTNITMSEYLRLSDDGCPNCPEHIDYCDLYRLTKALERMRDDTIARLLMGGLL